jgi:hypothetical protein
MVKERGAHNRSKLEREHEEGGMDKMKGAESKTNENGYQRFIGGTNSRQAGKIVIPMASNPDPAPSFVVPFLYVGATVQGLTGPLEDAVLH